MRFIEESLRKALDVKPAVATRLLASNARELGTVATVGLQGKNFGPIISWYQSLFPEVCLKNDPNVQYVRLEKS